MTRHALNLLSYESESLQQRARDERDLNWLATAHQVWGWILSIFGMLFVFHFVIGVLALGGHDPLGVATKYASLDDAAWTLVLVGALGMTGGCSLGFLNRLAGRALRQRQRHRLTVVTAVLNLVNIGLCVPLPTILGAFTLAVLRRSAVKELYACNNLKTPL
jgi:hypothetical protein